MAFPWGVSYHSPKKNSASITDLLHTLLRVLLAQILTSGTFFADPNRGNILCCLVSSIGICARILLTIDAEDTVLLRDVLLEAVDDHETGSAGDIDSQQGLVDEANQDRQLLARVELDGDQPPGGELEASGKRSTHSQIASMLSSYRVVPSPISNRVYWRQLRSHCSPT